MQQKLVGPIRRFIHAQSSNVEVYRQGAESTTQYGTNADYQSVGTRVLAFAGLQESMQPTGAGQIQSQRLTAYSLPDEDIQEDDRVDHAGTRVEVVAKYPLPNDQDEAITRYEFEDA